MAGRLLTYLRGGQPVTSLIARALLRMVRTTAEDPKHRAILGRMIEDLLLDRPDVFEWATYAPAETIMAEGEPLSTVLVLIQGCAIVRRHGRAPITVLPGAVIGQMSAISGRLPFRTVVAGNEAVEALLLPKKDFQEGILADAEVRAHVRELALANLARQYEGEKLSPAIEEGLRVVRDQNIDSLVRRQGIRAIASDGVFAALNPHAADYHERGAHVGPIEQKYVMLEATERLLKCGRPVGAIQAEARRIRQHALARGAVPESERVQAALAEFVGHAEAADAEYLGQVAALRPDAQSPDEFSTLLDRIKRIRWLEARLREDTVVDGSKLPARRLGEHVGCVARAPQPREVVDTDFRAVMELGIREASERLFRELSTVTFQRMEFDIHEFDHAPRLPSQDSASCECNRAFLAELRRRLARGELSAIGGDHYPQQRFSRAVLDAVAGGQVRVVVYDGTALDAERYARTMHGMDPRTGAVWRGLATQIQGLDGSGPRTLLTIRVRDGRAEQVLVIAGYGASRQLHNAGAILLYSDREGRRVPEEMLELASQNVDYVARLRSDVRSALREQAERCRHEQVLGRTLADPEALPVQLLILQNPRELIDALGPETVTLAAASGALLSFSVGYVDVGGTLVRLIVPKVGGDGLYGDTAGHFVTACFTAEIPGLLPNVVFNGTAGGFAGTAGTPGFEGALGLGDIKPGGIIVPVESIEQIGEGGPMPLRTLFGRAEPRQGLREMLEAIGVTEEIPVNFVSHHGAVPAPAIETYEYIEENLVGRKKGSVDVEGGRTWQAVLALGRPEITFTPFYTHSDDPRSSRENPSDSLAAMGPWFEGVEVDHRRYTVLRGALARSLVFRCDG